jgi:hypothetical protein
MLEFDLPEEEISSAEEAFELIYDEKSFTP